MRFRRIGAAAVVAAALGVGLVPGVARAQTAIPSAKQDAGAPTPKIDLNRASIAELISLPGIGPSKARAIVAARAKRRFRRPEDIIRVPGIGRKTYRRLRPFLTASAEPLPSRAK